MASQAATPRPTLRASARHSKYAPRSLNLDGLPSCDNPNIVRFDTTAPHRPALRLIFFSIDQTP
jgi:hypothetical protein